MTTRAQARLIVWVRSDRVERLATIRRPDGLHGAVPALGGAPGSTGLDWAACAALIPSSGGRERLGPNTLSDAVERGGDMGVDLGVHTPMTLSVSTMVIAIPLCG